MALAAARCRHCHRSVESAAAQSVEQFYRGRTITALVASQPGGVNDLVARLISRHLGNHIPGKPLMIVQNLQAAGLVLANRIYASAEKDGTVIGIIERGTPQLAIQGEPNARFDPQKMTWLGSVSSYADDAYVFWVNSTFAAKTVADLKPPSTLTAKIGTTGAGATNVVFTQISKDVLGLNVQNVRGYRGAADAFLAQQRGELDGQVVGLSAIKVWSDIAVQFRLLPAADRVRPHHALPRISRRADRARIDQRSKGAGAARTSPSRPSSWRCRSWRRRICRPTAPRRCRPDSWR